MTADSLGTRHNVAIVTGRSSPGKLALQRVVVCCTPLTAGVLQRWMELKTKQHHHTYEAPLVLLLYRIDIELTR